MEKDFVVFFFNAFFAVLFTCSLVDKNLRLFKFVVLSILYAVPAILLSWIVTYVLNFPIWLGPSILLIVGIYKEKILRSIRTNPKLINKFWFWVGIVCLFVLAIGMSTADATPRYWEDVLFCSIAPILFVISVAIGIKRAFGAGCVLTGLIALFLTYFSITEGDVSFFAKMFLAMSFLPGMIAFFISEGIDEYKAKKEWRKRQHEVRPR